MKQLISVVTILFVMLAVGFVQAQGMIFYNGGIEEGKYIWADGFVEDPASVPSAGYTPGTSALKFTPFSGGDWQYLFLGLDSNVGEDLTSIWDTDSVYFKLKASNGLAPTDTLYIWIYDSRNSDWDYAIYHKLENFHVIEDGSWHQFSVPLKDFSVNVNNIDTTDIVAVSFEGAGAIGQGIASVFYIDHVWIGDPVVRHELTMWNGKFVMPGVGTELWGFQDNNFKIAVGEGYLEGSDAVLWENGQDDWAGIGFYFDEQDLADTWAADSLKIKINAPSGINDLYLVWYDPDWNTATMQIAGSTFDGTWKIFEYALDEFTIAGELDLTRIYYFSIESYVAIPQRILIDDIWVGNPLIDFTPPPSPENVNVSVADPYVNQIAWDDIATESGETYDVYASMTPITALSGAGVFIVATDVAEGTVAVHNIYYPLSDGPISFYYAVTCTDAAGNVSEGFATAGPFSNTGKKRAIISLDEPVNFVADGNLTEWMHIEPFVITPKLGNWYGDAEVFDDSLDYTAFCYVAMDDTNLYVAFDVIDDVFSWAPENSSDWWNDESIEFYFGLYDLGIPHSYFLRGEEPDYRIVFRPNQLDYANGTEAKLYDEGTTNYYFQPLGASDYTIEARVPFEAIRAAEDSAFTPVQGSTIPFEIFAADADVANSGDVSRVQLGDNRALDPWGEGPDVWTFAWIGLPTFVSIDDQQSFAPLTYYLGDNYPNPFNPSTTIEYSIPKPAHVEMFIYNIMGQRIQTLVNKYVTAGRHNVTFDASGLASGVYFYQISTKNFNSVKKMILLK